MIKKEVKNQRKKLQKLELENDKTLKNTKRKKQFKKVEGITLIALIITMVLHYDKVKKCSNSNSFLLSSI